MDLTPRTRPRRPRTTLPPPTHDQVDDSGATLPAGWGGLGEPLDCSYPTVDMAWPGALALETAVTATDHRRTAPPAPPTDEDDPPPF